MNMRNAIFLSLLILTACTGTIPDKHTDYEEMQKIIGFTGIDAVDYAMMLLERFPEMDVFARAEYFLITARLSGGRSIVCRSVPYYKEAAPANNEEKALIYETIASLGCGEDSGKYYNMAAAIWDSIGNSFRAKVDRSLAENDNMVFTFSTEGIEELALNEGNAVIGKSSLTLNSDDKLLVQAERVSRDWLSGQLYSPYSNITLAVFSEMAYLPPEELLEEEGWHEGGRIRDMNLSYEAVTGTLAAKYDRRWYAPNENGIFMFEIPYDKIVYPTTRFLRDDLAVIIDVHGVNMMVEQAMRQNASAVMGCCDFPGKAKAALYLAERGKKVICSTDRFVPLLMGRNISVIGNAPFTAGKDVIMGNRPVYISKDDIVVAEDSSSEVQQYYDTAARYFSHFPWMNVLNVTLYNNGTYRLVDTARRKNATVIGGRVYNIDDYRALKSWLEEDAGRRIVLFHSMPYPYGKKLFNEFPEQTTFGDINPSIIEDNKY